MSNDYSDRWGSDDGSRRQVDSDSDSSWWMWIFAIFLILAIAGGGFMFFQVRQIRAVAMMEAARAAELRQLELERRVADLAETNAQKQSEPEKDRESPRSRLPDNKPASDMDEAIWPTIWLVARVGQRSVKLDGGNSASMVARLIPFLNDDDHGIREAAADWLGLLGKSASAAIADLQKALIDRDADVRAAASKAIRRIERREE